MLLLLLQLQLTYSKYIYIFGIFHNLEVLTRVNWLFEGSDNVTGTPVTLDSTRAYVLTSQRFPLFAICAFHEQCKMASRLKLGTNQPELRWTVQELH